MARPLLLMLACGLIAAPAAAQSDIRKTTVGQAGLIVDVQGHVFQLGVAGGAGVARRHQHFLHLFRLRHFPGQGVLAATAADDQDFHGVDSLMPV